MFVPDILKQIGFGQRELDFADFEQVCAALAIVVLFIETTLGGVAIPKRRNRRVIILDTNCSQKELLIRAWHEFAHLECGHSGVRLFLKGALDKAELQADEIALCCAIPTVWLEMMEFNDILEQGFSFADVWKRYEINEKCGI